MDETGNSLQTDASRSALPASGEATSEEGGPWGKGGHRNQNSGDLEGLLTVKDSHVLADRHYHAPSGPDILCCASSGQRWRGKERWRGANNINDSRPFPFPVMIFIHLAGEPLGNPHRRLPSLFLSLCNNSSRWYVCVTRISIYCISTLPSIALPHTPYSLQS
jgi:hypothetical protein